LQAQHDMIRPQHVDMGQLNTILTKTRVYQEPVIAHMEYN